MGRDASKLREGTTAAIGPHILSAEDEDSPAEEVTYSIQPPANGKVVLRSAPGAEVRRFTQAQINNGLILFVHQDAIRFRVVAPTTISDSFILLVLISFEAKCPQRSTQLWRNAGLQLSRAQRAEIDTLVLDASNLLSQIPVPERAAHDVVFLVTGLPAHGQLLVAGVPLEQSRPFFLQSDLATGRLAYAHGGDGTSEDRFRFKAWLRPRAQQSIRPPQEGVVISEAFNITVTSSSSKPPQVVKRQEVLRVPPGSVVTLSQEYLDVADPSGSPEEMVYSILQRPLAGHLAKAHSPQEPINRFTQADVNAGHVVFVATGSHAPGSLALSLSDGHHPPTSTSLEIEVLPAVSTTASPVLLEVPQDLNRAVVSQHHLLGTAQLGVGNVLYRITSDPSSSPCRGQ
ncbi:hypothetical protein llap_21756 [Limosa lapponica baueri]|uniref:Chondroitin sulfate proteoglycan 4 n=1 Tax=Limosa lapponica baueri TaxID=1758121 RepID=A0A2I0T2B0_LIMLA|nr:hypothetical protein llap_21756 [Limosa lapponica baueri]